ncbi:MAG: DUF262 domain-containing protein [Bacteroidales bacterium]|nr:DUF262 domain-containing protein [Bacteroidales bacterium]
MRTGRYSVSELLTSKEIEQIIIPELQRDYVWSKDNVTRLFRSIIDNFQKNNRTRLEIKDGGNLLDPVISDYLSEEYARLKYNTRIGFIYAYHSPEYEGRFFLIDGQQRMTTIFLLLLSAYKLAGKQQEFKNKYFKDNQPKIDYKVRESAHDFLVKFITHELDSGNSVPAFKESCEFYNIYNKDVTARNLYANFETIESVIQKELNGQYVDFIQYIENYIEFNYFDTNLSEQGEKLYLYMNSRGEGLSIQERLKPLIVGRQPHNEKTKVGESWEKWQDFFWVNRKANYNADKGFQEFVKWVTILHIIKNPTPPIKTVAHNGKTTKIEIIKDYINCDIKGQENWLRDYQENEGSFNYRWLESVFSAVERLADFTMRESECLPVNWLWDIQNTNEYIIILPCIYYLVQWPNATDREIKRAAMFFKNVFVYDETIYRDPDGTAIVGVQLVQQMFDNSISDFRELPVQGINSKLLENGVDEKKKKYYFSPFGDEWENAFWEIVQNKDFNKFLKGNISFLLDWNFLFGTRAIDFKIRADKVRKKIFEVLKTNKNQLLLDLLKYGNFYCDDGGGSSNLGPWLHRYTLINDDQTWYDALKEKTEIITQYLEGKVPNRSRDCLYDRIVKGNSNIIDYMKDNHFLKDDKGSRIVLLEKTQASENLSRELMVQWLHKTHPSSWVYDYQTLVIDFKIDLTTGQILNRYSHSDSCYYLDLIYEWKNSKSEWNVVIGHRKSAILATPIFIKNPSDWSCVDGKCKYNSTFPDDWSNSIQERIDDIIKDVNDLFNVDIIS